MTGQLLINGLLNAALIGSPGIAFTMMFAILRFPNFAVGGFAAVSAYAAWAANVPLGAPLWLAAGAAMALTALATWLGDRLVFRPIRSHSSVTLLVVSIALALVLENMVRLGFGNAVRGFDVPLTRPFVWNGLRITIEQIWVLGTALGVAAVTHGLLAYTRSGKAMRAVAEALLHKEPDGIHLADPAW